MLHLLVDSMAPHWGMPGKNALNDLREGFCGLFRPEQGRKFTGRLFAAVYGGFLSAIESELLKNSRSPLGPSQVEAVLRQTMEAMARRGDRLLNDARDSDDQDIPDSDRPIHGL